jgi:hypothetical protein
MYKLNVNVCLVLGQRIVQLQVRLQQLQIVAQELSKEKYKQEVVQ